MLPDHLIRSIETNLSEQTGKSVKATGASPIGGGCINNTYRLQTNAGNFFVKWNRADTYPNMFQAEAKGLQLLKAAGEIVIPEVITAGEADNQAYLILEYLEPGAQHPSFWEDFGASLARLHRHTAGQFGLDHNNYIGSLPQYNKQIGNWTDFFITQRLEVQIRIADLPGSTRSSFNNLFKHLPELFPEKPPALLHGDLWSGNYMTAPDGSACIIDPAVYYGHREMDIGMTRLFGGFDQRFYDAYNDTWPMEAGWEQRLDICNLYPLMVHVNLFGGGYLGQVESILKSYS